MNGFFIRIFTKYAKERQMKNKDGAYYIFEKLGPMEKIAFWLSERYRSVLYALTDACKWAIDRLSDLIIDSYLY